MLSVFIHDVTDHWFLFPSDPWTLTGTLAPVNHERLPAIRDVFPATSENDLEISRMQRDQVHACIPRVMSKARKGVGGRNKDVRAGDTVICIRETMVRRGTRHF